MHETIFYILIGIIIFEFLFSKALSIINSTWRNKELPNELQGIYEDDKYKKSQEYGKTNARFGFFTSTFQLFLILLMLFLGGFAYFDNIAAQYSSNPVFISLIFFGILFFLSDILGIPFSIYATFVIEEKFGFNKTTAKLFFWDKIKSLGLSIIIGGILLGAIVWFYYETTEMFWIYAWVLVSGFSIFMAMFYSNLIVPLFNKQKPLEDGELKEAINEFSKKVGFKLDNIFVIDGSKRSSKANAYFTGLGKKKRIVLYDTLINDLEIDEIVAVLAHEIGHYKLKHTLYSIVLSVLQTGIFSPISTIIGLAMNVFSRKNEYQADDFAKKHNLGESLISALKKLSANSLSNLTPHPAFIFVYFSHPSLYQRILSINKK